MRPLKKMQEWMAGTLLIGTLISAIFVAVGGLRFLLQNGTQNLSFFLQHPQPKISLSTIFYNAFSFSAVEMIELGLFLLVATQILRVILLAVYYLLERDYYFLLTSLFILFILFYSLFAPK